MNGQYLNGDSNGFKWRIRLFLNGGNLATLVKALTFLLAFEQILETCLSGFRLLSNVISRNLTLLLSQNISLSNFSHICLFLFPDIKRWHLPVLSFMQFISNQAIASSEFCSNVSSTDFKFESRTRGVVLSAMLHISILFSAKYIRL